MTFASTSDSRRIKNFVRSEPDLRAPVLGKGDLVALREIHRHELPVVVPGARPDGEDTAALRLLLRRTRKHDAAARRLLLLEDLDDQRSPSGCRFINSS
jgi:hypothetical protein